MKTIALLVIASVLMGSSCEPEPEVAKIKVISVRRSAGDCIFETPPETCHRLTVLVDNRDGDEDFSLNMFYWAAQDKGGGIYTVPQRTGPDAVGVGREVTFTLGFDAGYSPLVELRYESRSASISTSVPRY